MALSTGSKMTVPLAGPKKINLTLPKHWNQCTREQLELIADVMREQIEKQDRYHPFSMKNVKIALFFALSNLQIVQDVDTRLPIVKQYYLCRVLTPEDKKQKKSGLEKKLKSHKGKDINLEDEDGVFRLYLWQVNYWLSPKAKTDNKQSAEYIGQGADILGWLDNKNGMYLTWFPYDKIERKKIGKFCVHRESGKFFPSTKKIFSGPNTELDGFSWAQYRFASDMMGTYTKLSNSLLIMQQRGTFSEEQIKKQADNVELAKSMFLATIFNAQIRYIQKDTGLTRLDYHYEGNQCSDNAEYFRGFPDNQWQVILFWWTGIMHTLSKRYPHVFKVQPLKSQRSNTPLEIYTATTATMQKYAGLTEDQVNNQSYSLVLEHLERLSKENEEMEKMRRK